MDKKQALIILLHNSNLVKEDAKNDLISKINTLSDQEIDTLGKFFSVEMALNSQLNPNFLNTAIQE